jgi:hypothetical protein
MANGQGGIGQNAEIGYKSISQSWPNRIELRLRLIPARHYLPTNKVLAHLSSSRTQHDERLRELSSPHEGSDARRRRSHALCGAGKWSG